MALTLFFLLLTLLPLAFGLLLAVLGAARLARPPVALILTVLGALAAPVCVALLASDLPGDVPTLVALLGAPGVWFAPLYRLDSFSFYAACGVAFVIAPLLLWLAWRAAPPLESALDVGETDRDDQAPARAIDAEAPLLTPIRRGFTGWLSTPESLPRWAWVGLALALALESVAISFVFADNLLWLAFCWLLLVVLAWALGELGSDFETLDWFGLGAMALGPLAWLAITLTAAIPVGATRLYDLTGQPRFTLWHVIGYAFALALAGGAYPFLLWVRRRASFTTPAGVAAVTLAVLPASLLVGLRTYAFTQGGDNSWPRFSPSAPITSGIVFVVLGVASVLFCGLLALGRRDGRALLALLAVTQIGWGLLGLGIGAPLGALGVTLLLATSVLGLGAAVAALVAGGALTADIEPESAGPRAFGAKLQPFTLAAWCVGVASLVGAPLLAGFASQQVISASGLGLTPLNMPLVGIAWAGDALLALALLRATAAAFASDPLAHVEAVGEDTPLAANLLNARATAILADTLPVDTLPAKNASLSPEDAVDESADGVIVENAGSDDAEDVDDLDDLDDLDEDADAGAEDDEPAPSDRRTPPALPELTPDEIPAAILALLTLIVGVAPQLLLIFGGRAAAASLLQTGALDTTLTTAPGGYLAGASQWPVGIVAVALVTLVALVAFLRSGGRRVMRPVYLAGQAPATAAVSGADGEPTALAPLGALDTYDSFESLGMAEPTEVWRELQPLFHSDIALPGVNWIVSDEDEDEDEDTTDTTDTGGAGNTASGATDDDTATSRQAKPARDVASGASSAKMPVAVKSGNGTTSAAPSASANAAKVAGAAPAPTIVKPVKLPQATPSPKTTTSTAGTTLAKAVTPAKAAPMQQSASNDAQPNGQPNQQPNRNGAQHSSAKGRGQQQGGANTSANGKPKGAPGASGSSRGGNSGKGGANNRAGNGGRRG